MPFQDTKEQTPENPPAFPKIGIETDAEGRTYSYDDAQGMSLRDYFAGQAIAGQLPIVLKANFLKFGQEKAEEIAHEAYMLADAMIRERAKKE